MNTVTASIEGSIVWVRLTEDAVHNYEAANVDQIVETIHSTLADEFRTRFETIDEFEARFQGVLIIQSLANPSKSWAWYEGRAKPLSNLTFRQIEAGIAEIEQSVEPGSEIESLRRNKFGFLFTNPIRGAGKTKKPSYITRFYKQTWVPQEYHNSPVNCGAFAIIYQQTPRASDHLNDIRREAFLLQTHMNWGTYVAVDDLLKYVEYNKNVRLTVVIPSVNSYGQYTRAGSNYQYTEEDGIIFNYRQND